MTAWDQPTRSGRRTAAFFGTVLCVLLALFAVERKVAAYPTHSVAAATVVATGVQKPQQITFEEPQGLASPVLCLCHLALFAASPIQGDSYAPQSQNEFAFPRWAPTPLAVRPPPAL